MLRSLINSIWSSSDQQDVLTGQFFERDTCIYAKAKIQLKPSSQPLIYQLFITKEQTSSEEELEDEDEHLFLCSLELKLQALHSNILFNHDNKRYKFVANESNLVDRFFSSFASACYEKAHQKKVDISKDDVMSWYEDKQKEPVTSASVSKEECVFQSDNAEFYYYDGHAQSFILQDPKATVKILRDSNDRFSHFLTVESPVKTYMKQALKSDLNVTINKTVFSFIWNYRDESDQLWSLSVKFASLASLETLMKNYSLYLYESLSRDVFEKVKNEDSEYVLHGYAEDVEMEDAPSEEETEDESSAEESAEEEFSVPASSITDSPSAKNKHLAVSYASDRSYVVRGNSVGVFKAGNQDNLEFVTSIKNVRGVKGKEFEPSKIMLHEQDSSMLLLNPDQKDTIYKMDIERGQVVEEWKVEENALVSGILPEAKYAQMTPSKSLVGFNRNSIFRLDPRINTPYKKTEGKSYASKSDFSGASTTGKGELAVVSNTGDIRLFNKLDIRAKTLLPGFGDPILSVDTSEDGKYVLATCKTYLLVIKTEHHDNSGTTGFTKSLGKNKPAPIRLQLKPEHAAYIGEISFTPAKFNTGDLEKSIVSSTGPYIITWNFRHVKMGKLDSYMIKKYDAEIVADNFKFNQVRDIVVTLPHQVTIASKLASPKRLKKQDVVNSPF